MNDLINPIGKAFMLRFLPYLERADGSPVEPVIGYDRKTVSGYCPAMKAAASEPARALEV